MAPPLVRPVFMRLPGYISVFVVALLLAPQWAIAAPRTEVRVLEQSVDRTVVRIDAGPIGRWTSFALAIPTPRVPTVRILAEDSYPLEPDQDSRPEGRVVATEPGQFRGTWTSSVHVALEWQSPEGPRRARSVTVAIDHPSGGELPRRSGLDEVRVPGAFLNSVAAARMVAPRVALRTAAPFVEDTFARSPNWVRIEVAEGGLYRIDYAALRGVLGSAVDFVDPASLRIFSARRRIQPTFPSREESSWDPALGLREHAIHVSATEATLVPGDEMIALLHGVEGWADEYDATADWLDHDENTWDTSHAFWLTWEEAGVSLADFDAPPLRMQVVESSPAGTPDRILQDVRVRTHAEVNAEPGFGNTPDNWTWTSFIDRNESRTHEFRTPSAIPDSVLWVRTRPTAEINGARQIIDGPNGPIETYVNIYNAEYEISGVFADAVEWTLPAQRTAGGYWFRFSFTGLQSGTNAVRVRNTSRAGINLRNPLMFVDGFDMHWRSELRPDPEGRLDWVIPPREATAGRWRYTLSDPSARLDGAIVLDTTSPFSPRWLEPGLGRNDSRSIDFDFTVAGATFAKLQVTTRSGLRTPLSLTAGRPRLLRDEVRQPDGSSGTGYDYIVLASSAFMSAAEDLGRLRRRDLLGADNARVAVVDLQDVYDQFGHGGKDPAAMRNFVKFLYEIDAGLSFVTLMGDANRDSRGVLPNSNPDWCPTFVESAWPYHPDRAGSRDESLVPFARDDWFVSLDDPVVRSNNFDLDLPDLSIGRLPANSPAEAARLVDILEDYVESPDPGGWKNSILLAADDEIGGNGSWETYHIADAEVVSEELLPRAIDRRKLYLTEYPNVGTARSKPSARQDFIADWSAGQLIVHYVGHGSPQQLADEVLFRIEDVSALRNDRKRSLFLGFSCDVAIFDDPTVQSMSEALVLSPAGGAIATIAATYVTYVGPNRALTRAYYGRLYPEVPGSLVPRLTLGRSAAIGTALLEAKIIGSPPDNFISIWRQKNDAKYVILGDSAVRLQSPEQDVSLSGDLTTRVLTGQLERLDGSAPGLASGNWSLLANESADSVRYEQKDGPGILPYVLPGNSFFTGEGAFTGTTGTATLRTPANMRLGQNGRVRMLLEDTSSMHVGLADSLPVARGALDTEDREGPTIDFENYSLGQILNPGQDLIAVIEDSSGVNVLGSVAANSILADFDDSGVAVDFTDRFVLDESSYTRGTVIVTLPDDLAAGSHSLTLSAGDMVGNVTLRSIEFGIQEAVENGIVRHAPFPNPFRDSTRFVVEISSSLPGSVDLSLDLYTVGGAHVRSLSASINGSGRVPVLWDGQDRRGDGLANGTYLYVVRARFGGSSPFTETATGRVVLMR